MMRKTAVILALFFLPAVLALCIDNGGEGLPIAIPASKQREGNATNGYTYLTSGDLLKSGVPYQAFISVFGKNTDNLLQREGKNATVSHVYNVINHKGVDMVVPTCLQCHAQVFEGKLVIGLGNTGMDFTSPGLTKYSKTAIKVMRIAAHKKYVAAKPFYQAVATSFPLMGTEVRGVNTADKLAIILAAHRDPETLKWHDKAMLAIPKEVIPTDVPAWWLMKKKNAMFYNGFARGDLSRYMMLSNLLTVVDTAEAREVGNHFGDVLAYIRSLEPPKYPKPIDNIKVEQGRLIFNENCSRCHGTYGADGYYPNLLIPSAVIQTDSALYIATRQNQAFIDWFNKSWFAKGDNPPKIELFNGYLAPPLDGVWATAPYLHNGSVPTLEALLNSKHRPTYWSRDFQHRIYDYDAIGWKYDTHTEPIAKKTYNTTLKGYGNSGHYFGDFLSDAERWAVIEYLKTL
jgi:mono/diheme cytochrome c family protein